MKKTTVPYAIGLLALLFLVKGWTALALGDVFFYGEELEKGAAAKAMLDGLALEHHQLAYHYYEGGGFVVSHLTALAFTLVGENLLAHKLVSLAFNAAILLVGLRLASRFFSPRAGLFFGLLYVFAPAAFQKLSLLNLGIHYEAGLFVLLVLGLTLEILLDEESRDGRWFGLGLAAGFGFFFNYQLAPAMAWSALWLAVAKQKALGGRAPYLAVLGLVLGLVPLFLMASQVGTAVFDIHGQPLLGGEEEEVAKPSHLGFLASLYEGRGAADQALLALRQLAFLALPLVLFLPWSKREPRERTAGLFLAGYVGCFALTYLLTGFAVEKASHHFLLQRFAPAWLVGTLLLAAALDRGLRLPGLPGRALAAVAALLLAAGLFDAGRVLAGGHPTTLGANADVLLATKGYDYPGYLAKVKEHIEGSEAEKLRVLTGFDEEDRELLYAGAVWPLFEKSDTAPNQIFDLFERADPEGWHDYLLGLGPYLWRVAGRDTDRAWAFARANKRGLSAYLEEALGRRGVALHSDAAALERELDYVAGRDLGEAYLRGLGWSVYATFRLDEPGAERFFEDLDPSLRAPLRAGWERAREAHRHP